MQAEKTVIQLKALFKNVINELRKHKNVYAIIPPKMLVNFVDKLIVIPDEEELEN